MNLRFTEEFTGIGMKYLVVLAHPLKKSLCHHLLDNLVSNLELNGHQIQVKDLYSEKFIGELTETERKSYFSGAYDSCEVENDIRQLKEAEALVIIFPTWWFSFPAILKGWFDRVWVPGHAFEFSSSASPMLNLKEIKVITTLGASWWVDKFVMKSPIKRIIRDALMRNCTKNCEFSMLSLYNSENISDLALDKFIKKMGKII